MTPRGSPSENGLQTEVPTIQTEVSGAPMEEAPEEQAADVPELSAQPPIGDEPSYREKQMALAQQLTTASGLTEDGQIDKEIYM